MKTLPLIQCCVPIAGELLSDADAAALERLFRILGDRHRVKILNLLARAGGGDVCVCELVPKLGLAQATVSYHLKQLVDTGLLARERRGTFSYYRLVPGTLDRVREAFSVASEAGPAGSRVRSARPGRRPSSRAGLG